MVLDSSCFIILHEIIKNFNNILYYNTNLLYFLLKRVKKKLNCLIFPTANTIETKDDEFWDYDKQVDLEAFNSRTLYDTLSKQSRAVTNTIGKHKDEVRAFQHIYKDLALHFFFNFAFFKNFLHFDIFAQRHTFIE